MTGSFFSSLSTALVLHWERNLHTEQMNHLHRVQRKKKTPVSKPHKYSGKLASFLTASQSRWEFSLLLLSFWNLCAITTHTHTRVLCIDWAETTKLLNSGWSQVPGAGTLPPTQAEEAARAGRSRCLTDSFSSGFPASLACQTSLLKIPASPSMSQVSCGKKPDFISGGNRCVFGCTRPGAEAWASRSCALPATAARGLLWSWRRAPARPGVTATGRASVRALWGPRPGCRVCPVFPHHLDVLLIICQTGDVTRWGAVATAGNIGSWKGPLSRGPSRHLGRSPGAKGGKSKLPFRLLSSAGTRGASGTRPNCVISAPKAKHVVIQSKEALPKLQPPSCIIYYDCG